MTLYHKMVEVVPEHKVGVAEIRHVEVSPFWATIESMKGRPLRAGKLCQLLVNGELMMSDGTVEHRSNLEFVHEARGEVLIAGLGIGFILAPILEKPEVKSVTVVEKYPDVVTLVEESVRCNAAGSDGFKFNVEVADIFKYTPDKQYDVIYFDIWPNITTDNLEEIKVLKRKFKKFLKPDGWMGAWFEDELKRQRRQQRSELAWY